ncbi:uncharacterized protein LOC113350260 isoform X2 [Papaver somniferum]|uniref:uncharacterized protein LOC113350260 isoform X2 n=1 Tax=Papaver somniferum TaxID=3469 RepID=UPI000E6FBE86|nr:uncharacterized protein LOC113350260 isoform X2 [Papaver somniferum]
MIFFRYESYIDLLFSYEYKKIFFKDSIITSNVTCNIILSKMFLCINPRRGDHLSQFQSHSLSALLDFDCWIQKITRVRNILAVHTPITFFQMGSQTVNNPSKIPASTYKTFSHIGKAEEGTKWMTRVRISRKWNELDFMGTYEVTSLDVFMLDDNIINWDQH